MNDKEKVLLGAACFFAGAVVGFLLAPVKKGIYCGNNSGNTYGPGEEETVKDELEEKRMKRIDNSLRDFWENTKCTKTHVIGVLEEEKKKK